jgi:pimeloyl-ACP methyl ester carboxylesterase
MESSKLIPIEYFDGIAATHLKPEELRGSAPIVFVHGAGGGKLQFRHWQRYCADRGWESYAIDLQGHHDSDTDKLAKASLADYAADVERLISRIGACYLVGHSMGGLVVQIVASRSAQVKGAVLVASSPPAGVIGVNWFIISLMKHLPRALLGKPIALSANDRQRFITNRLPPTTRDAPLSESAVASRGMIFQRIWIKGLKCPTLVISAGLDRAIPRSAGRQLARKYHADYLEIPGMAHMLMLEPEWEQPIEAILEWLIHLDPSCRSEKRLY